jgi:RHS repeat-associated protein
VRSVLFVLLVWVVGFGQIDYSDNGTNTKQYKKIGGAADGNAPNAQSSGSFISSFQVDQFTGQLVANIPLFNVAKYKLLISYNSLVQDYFEKPNFMIPNSEVAVGFNLSKMQIVSDHKNTTTHTDDDFLLMMSEGSRYEIMERDNGTYYTIPYTNLKISKNVMTSTVSNDEIIVNWEVIDESGTKYIFGDDTFNINNFSAVNATRFLRAWHGIITNGWENTNAEYVPFVWDIAKIQDRFDSDIASFTYVQHLSNVGRYGKGDATNKYTVNSFLTNAVDHVNGKSVTLTYNDFPNDDLFYEKKVPRGFYSFYNTKFLNKIVYYKENTKTNELQLSYQDIDGVNSMQKRKLLSKIKTINDRPNKNEISFEYILTDPDLTNKHTDNYGRLYILDNGIKRITYDYQEQSLADSEVSHGFSNTELYGSSSVVGNGYYITMVGNDRYTNSKKFIFYYINGEWKKKDIGLYTRNIIVHPSDKKFLIVNRTSPNSRTVDEWYFENLGWKKRTFGLFTGMEDASDAGYTILLSYKSDIAVITWRGNNSWNWHLRMYQLIASEWHQIHEKINFGDNNAFYTLGNGYAKSLKIHHYENYVLITNNKGLSSGNNVIENFTSYLALKNNQNNWVFGSIPSTNPNTPTSRHFSNKHFIINTPYGTNEMKFYRIDYNLVSSNIQDYLVLTNDYTSNGYGVNNRMSTLADNRFIYQHLFEFDGNGWSINPDATFAFNNNESDVYAYFHNNSIFVRDPSDQTTIIRYEENSLNQLFVNQRIMPDAQIKAEKVLSTAFGQFESYWPGSEITRNFYFDIFDKYPKSYEITTLNGDNIEDYSAITPDIRGNGLINIVRSDSKNNSNQAILQFIWPKHESYNIDMTNFTDKYHVKTYKYNDSPVDFRYSFSFYGNSVNLNRNYAPYTLFINHYRNTLHDINITATTNSVDGYYVVRSIEIEDKLTTEKITNYYNYTGGKLDNELRFAKFSQVETYVRDKTQGYTINNFVYDPYNGDGDFTNSNEYLYGQIKSSIVYDGNNEKVSETINNYFVDKKESDSYKVQLKSVINRNYPKSGVNDFSETETINTFEPIYDFVIENITKKRIMSGTTQKSINTFKNVTKYAVLESSNVDFVNYLKEKNLITALDHVLKYNKNNTPIAKEIQKYINHSTHYLPVSKIIWIDRNNNNLMDEPESDYMRSDSIISFSTDFLPLTNLNLNSNTYNNFIYDPIESKKVIAKVNNAESGDAFFYPMGDLKDNGDLYPNGVIEYKDPNNSVLKSISDFTRTGNGHSLYVFSDVMANDAGIQLDHNFKNEFLKQDYIIEFDLYIESGSVKLSGTNGLGDIFTESETGKWLHKRTIIRKRSVIADYYLRFLNYLGQDAKFYINNVRLYPKRATMESYVYNSEIKVQTAVIDKSGSIVANTLNSNYKSVMLTNEKNELSSSKHVFNGSYNLGTLDKYQSITTEGIKPGHHENFNDQNGNEFSVLSNHGDVSLDYSKKFMEFDVTASASNTSNTAYEYYNNPEASAVNAEVTITTINLNSSQEGAKFTQLDLYARAELYEYRIYGTIKVEYLNESNAVLSTENLFTVDLNHASAPPPGPNISSGSEDKYYVPTYLKDLSHSFTNVPVNAKKIRIKWTKSSLTGSSASNSVVTNSYIRLRAVYNYNALISEEIVTYKKNISNQRISVEYDVKFLNDVKSSGFYYRGERLDINPRQIKWKKYSSNPVFMSDLIAQDEWHRVKIIIEPVNTTSVNFYLYINGDNAINTVDHKQTISISNVSLNKFGFYSPNYLGKIQIDNVSIFKEPVYITKFYDASGNETQKQVWNGENNLISSNTFDTFNRLKKSYQPFPNNTPFVYSSNFDTETKTYRGGNQYPFIEYEYYNKPGSNVKKQSQVGHSIISRFSESKEATLVESGSIPSALTTLLPDTYWKMESIDPDQVKNIEYQDVFEHVVATELQSNKTGTLEQKYTVNVYDEFGRMIKNYSPNSNFFSTNPTFVDSFTYNEFNKIKTSAMVNEGTNTQIFDRLGVLRAKKLANYDGSNGYYWEIYKYDRYGRLLVEGLLNSNISVIEMQGIVDQQLLFIEQKAINGSDPAGNYNDFLKSIIYDQSQSPFNQIIYNDKVHIFNSTHTANDLIFNPGFETATAVDMVAGHNILNEVPSSLKVKSIYFYDDYNFDLSTNSSQDLSGVNIEEEINAMGQLTREISYLSDTEFMTETYLYDEYGNIKEKRVLLPNLNEKNIVYGYNEETRQLDKVDYNPSGDGTDRIVMDYTYNNLGQLTTVESSDDGTINKRLELTNTYDLFGRQNTVSPNNTGNHSLVYSYDHLDRLSEINNFNSATSAIFSEAITYRVDGLIDYAEYQNSYFSGSTSSDAAIYKYDYNYNNFGELSSADYQYKSSFGSSYLNSTDFDVSYTYDKNGNVLTLNRNYSSSSDNWTYLYYSNTDKLKSIGGVDLTYDVSGLLRNDPTRNVNLDYDHKKRLKSAVGAGINDQYQYDNKTRRVKTINQTTGITSYYIYGLSDNAIAIYENQNIKEWALGSFGTKIKTGTGRKSTYYFKDHKGNLRASIDETGQIISAQDYFPFAKVMRSYSLAGNGKQRYKYSGKELDASTNYSYYGYRYYNADLARWMNPDPAHQGFSPYQFNGNIPHITVDTDGRWWQIPALIVFTKSFIAGRNAWSKNQSTGDFFNAFGKQLFSVETAITFASAGIGNAIGEAIAGASYIAKLGVNVGTSLGFNGVNNIVSGNDFFAGWEMSAGQAILTTTLEYVLNKIRIDKREELAVKKIIEGGGVPDDPLDATDENLKDFADKHFSDLQEKANNPELGVEKIDLTRDGYINTSKGPAYGSTTSTGILQKHGSDVVTESSKISIAPAAFNSQKRLYLVLGHEYIHAFQFAVGIPYYMKSLYGIGRQDALLYMEWTAHAWSGFEAIQKDWLDHHKYFLNLAGEYRNRFGLHNRLKLGFTE